MGWEREGWRERHVGLLISGPWVCASYLRTYRLDFFCDKSGSMPTRPVPAPGTPIVTLYRHGVSTAQHCSFARLASPFFLHLLYHTLLLSILLVLSPPLSRPRLS